MREAHRTPEIGQQFLHELAAALYIVAVVLFLWKNPAAVSLFLGAGISFWLWRFRDKADAAAMVAAALLGTPSEMVCVHYGVWTYRIPGLVLGIPVWIPLIWASLFCLFRRISATGMLIAVRIWPSRDLFPRKNVFRLLAVTIIAYYIVVALTVYRGIAIVYTIVVIIAAVFWHGERDILIFIISGILGTFGEYICMKFGLWLYHFPVFKAIGLPVSLPIAWGLSGIIIGRIAGVWEENASNHGQQ